MTNHYLKIAFRSLSRQKMLSFINILGLSIGLACFSLFLLYAVNEFSYDRFHKNASNIYRVYEWTEGLKGMEAGGDAWLYMPLGPAMKKDLPAVENFVRYQKSFDDEFIKAGNNISRTPVSYADPQILTVFSFPLLYGNPATALQSQRNVVLTKDRAQQLFGETNVIGKTIEIKTGEKFEPFLVTAVAENIPANSSLQFDVLLSFDYLETTAFAKNAVNNWHYTGFVNFVQVRNRSRLPDEKNTLARFREKYFPDEKAQLKNEGLWDGKGADPISFRLQPLRDMHTNTRISAGGERGSDTKYIWILLSIATGLLLIACINFTTLAIGRSAGRAKEVGVRKVIGSGRLRLIFQFLTEAMFLSLVSGVIGLILIQLLLPYFNQLSGKELQFSFIKYPELSWLFAGLVLLAGILAGSYPALVLSGFKPIETLKNKIRLGGSNGFTKLLVTLQFALSIILIVSTITILQQLNYMRSKNPGFNKENIIVVNADGSEIKKVYPLFKQRLMENGLVLGISGSNQPFGEGYNQSGFDYNGKTEPAFHFTTDADFIKIMGMQLVAGRNFDPRIASDSTSAAVVNEALVRDLGLTNEKAIGLKLKGYSRQEPVLIGVVKNFNFLPLKQQISALVINQSSHFMPSRFFVRIRPGNPSAALDLMKKTWTNMVADIPFQYSFLDDDLDHEYKTEARWSGIVGWAAGISIFLACLGLLGLAALSAANRTKEIGIRKVMGGSVAAIVQLLSKDFLRLVLVAFLIASPLAWYIMHKWLQDYAYRITMEWWVFLATGATALLIAFATVGFQAIRAASADPVKSLRTE